MLAREKNSSEFKKRRVVEGERMKIVGAKIPSISASSARDSLKLDQGLRKSMKNIDSMMSLFANIPDFNIKMKG